MPQKKTKWLCNLLFLVVVFLVGSIFVYVYAKKNSHNVDTIIHKLELQSIKKKKKKRLHKQILLQTVKEAISHLLQYVPEICKQLNSMHDKEAFLKGFPEELSGYILERIEEWCGKEWSPFVMEVDSIRNQLKTTRITSERDREEVKKCEQLLKQVETSSKRTITELTKLLHTASKKDIPALEKMIAISKKKEQEIANILELSLLKYVQLLTNRSITKETKEQLEQELNQLKDTIRSNTNKYKREITDVFGEYDKLLTMIVNELNIKIELISTLEIENAHNKDLLDRLKKDRKIESDKLKRIISLKEGQLTRIQDEASLLSTVFDNLSAKKECEKEYIFMNPILDSVYRRLKSYLCETIQQNEVSDEELLRTLSELLSSETDVNTFYTKCKEYTHPVLKVVCEKGNYMQSKIHQAYQEYQTSINQIEQEYKEKETKLRKDLQEAIINNDNATERAASLVSNVYPELAAILRSELHKRNIIVGELTKSKQFTSAYVRLYHQLYDILSQKEELDKICSADNVASVVNSYTSISSEITTESIQNMVNMMCQLKLNQIVQSPIKKEVCLEEQLFLEDLRQFTFEKINSFLSINPPEEEPIYTIIKTILLYVDSLPTIREMSCVDIRNAVQKIASTYPSGILSLRSYVSNSIEDYKGYTRVYIRIKPSKTLPISLCNVNVNLDRKQIQIDCSMENHCNTKDVLTYSNFSSIFPDTDTTTAIFIKMKSLFDQLKNGYSIVLFGYGVSGSGKTYTLLGEDGLLKQVLYSKPYSDDVRSVTIIRAFELYSNNVPDLTILAEKNKGLKGERINHISSTFFSPAVKIPSFDDFKRELGKIEEKRIKEKRIKPTINNSQSSRSHLFVTIEIEYYLSNSNKTVKGYITVVDMAGRESPYDIYNSSFDLSSSVGKLSMADAVRALPAGLSKLNINPELKKLYDPLLKNEQAMRLSIIDSVRESFFINETMNHLVYYLQKKIGINPVIFHVDTYASYKENQFFTDPSVSKGETSVGIIPIMREIENLVPKGKHKYVMMCTVRQEMKYCKDTVNTLSFASGIKST